ncbi:MAG: ferrochelatase, partial [Gammaproteobacteria bacterium]
ARSARAYKKIWMENGSPLAVLSRRLCQRLAERIGGDFRVELAMRYGEPSIQRKLNVFRSDGVNKIVILPLYPQYSLTTTASVFDAVFKEIKTWPYIPEVRFINDYYRCPEYIQAIAESIRTFRTRHGKGQMLLISFHGLPEKSIEIGDPYYDQCRRTASSVAGRLGLGENEWQMVFQSRFGAAEWLKPYCVDVLKQLPERGIKDIDVVCPGFAVDCLETLEEIGIANKAVFLGAGGENYRYIPSLNDEPSHVDALVSALFATG